MWGKKERTMNEKIVIVMSIIVVFLVGAISSTFIEPEIIVVPENSARRILEPSSLLADSPIKEMPLSGAEILSPSDWVSEDQIKVYPDQIVLDIKDAVWAKFADTNSMDPFLDSGTNAIEIKPQNPDQIQPGDIIAYTTDDFEGTIIHRVIAKGVDGKGTYFIAKGDNNVDADPYKIRFSQISYVLIAVIY
jgi:hypothetical protein